MKIKFSILLVCLLFFTCKKDSPVSPPVNNTTDCLNLQSTNVAATLNWPDIDTVYNVPRFNPTNSNEIVYVQGIVSTSKTYLVKRNLSTGQETQIISDVWQRPDWSVKDWIVFNHADNQVWKIKSNGDSLTLITTNLQNGFNAVWSPDGNKIAYAQEALATILITDVNGNYVDSLPYFALYLSRWSCDGNYICATAHDHINAVYQNVYTKQIVQPTNNTNNNMQITWMDWTPDTKFIIWANSTGIYKTNVSTKETIKLKNACNSKYYTSVSVSPDGQKIIAQRADQKLAHDTVYIKDGLSLIDIDGKNEVIIK
jgi:Tol biopolymer transport system component